jgi:aldehyde dehydrogenase (NAD+)
MCADDRRGPSQILQEFDPMNLDFTMTIDGQSQSGSERFGVENPATGKTFAEAPDCTRGELDQAVAAARKAAKTWAATSIDDRRQALMAMAGVLAQNVDELMRLLTTEQGKPHGDAQADVLGGAHWLAETAKLDLPEHVSEDSEERYAVTRHVPVGVVAAIVPWNFPVGFFAREPSSPGS